MSSDRAQAADGSCVPLDCRVVVTIEFRDRVIVIRGQDASLTYSQRIVERSPGGEVVCGDKMFVLSGFLNEIRWDGASAGNPGS